VRRASLAVLVIALAGLPSVASADTVYTVDNGAPPFLGKFDTATPGDVTVIGPVTGLLGASDLITAIDFRPTNGKLYAISNQNRIYTIDTSTAAATVVGDTAFTPAIPSGAAVGADFDPVRDVLRVITDGIGGPSVNLRISPTTGQAITDTQVHKDPADNSISNSPCIAAVAYSNNFPGAQSTTDYAFGICGGSDLLRVGSAGDPFSSDLGLLTLVQESDPYVHVTVDLRLGLDIAPGGAAYALVQQGPRVYFYDVDLREGAQTLLHPVLLGAQPRDSSTEWGDIAIAPAANAFSFSAASYPVGETAGSATVTVTRAGPAIGTSSVAYSTSDGSATSPSDYTPVSGTLSFAAGQRSATFSVPIADDADFEQPESLNVALSAPAGGAASLAEPSGATVTIDSNDPAPPGPPDTTRPTLAVASPLSMRLAAFLKGVKVKATPGEPAALKFELVAKRRGTRPAVTKNVVLASTALPIAAGARTATLKPSGRLVGKPRKAFTARLRVTATDAVGNRKVVTKTLTVKPDKKRKRSGA
jgi:Domain of unknown function (DUF4394)/Calx-beta domain